MDHLIPDGYSLRSPYGDGVTAGIAFEVLDCDALVMANQTLPSVSVVFVGILVRADDPPTNATEIQLYQVEWLIDNATAAAEARSRGFNAYEATIESTEADRQFTTHVSVQEDTWYELQGYAGQTGRPPATDTVTHFHEDAIAGLLFDHAAGGVPHAVQFTATGGALGGVGIGQMAGLMAPGPASVDVSLSER